MSAPRPSVVLFDLDGTLSDSARGILSSLRHAFGEFGLPPLSAEAEQGILGPPFSEALPPHLGTVAVADITAAYRAHYHAGAMFETSCYPGMSDVLDHLRERGTRMAVATSKPEHSAVPILEHLGLRDYFETVGGDTLSGTRGSKAAVIGEVLARMGDPDPDSVLMVGDRSHDVLGARANGIECAGAQWGYAQPAELTKAGARWICARPADLGALLGSVPV